jgi:2-polyprenyl-3-methyl-5-hydroxy-6-metoxy-1,4-benzoquinol methylase
VSRLVDVRCNLCGEDHCSVVFDAGVAQFHRIVRCKSCGLMYANPRSAIPEHALLRERDPDAPGWLEQYTLRRLKEEQQVCDLAGTRAALCADHPERGRLLEIGSGFGCLLDVLGRDGWDVLGLDPFEGFCRYAREHFGVETRPTILEDAGLSDGAFEVVLMLHVIEHLHDPLGTLREIHRVLAPGGTLVLETPRYDSGMFRLFGRRERSVSCDAHLTFYTNRTLRALAERAGYEVLEVAEVGRSLNLMRVLWVLGVMSKSPRLRRSLVSISRWLHLERVRFRLNVRDMVRMRLRKTRYQVNFHTLPHPRSASCTSFADCTEYSLPRCIS